MTTLQIKGQNVRNMKTGEAEIINQLVEYSNKKKMYIPLPKHANGLIGYFPDDFKDVYIDAQIEQIELSSVITDYRLAMRTSNAALVSFILTASTFKPAKIDDLVEKYGREEILKRIEKGGKELEEFGIPASKAKRFHNKLLNLERHEQMYHTLHQLGLSPVFVMPAHKMKLSAEEILENPYKLFFCDICEKFSIVDSAYAALPACKEDTRCMAAIRGVVYSAQKNGDTYVDHDELIEKMEKIVAKSSTGFPFTDDCVKKNLDFLIESGLLINDMMFCSGAIFYHTNFLWERDTADSICKFVTTDKRFSFNECDITCSLKQYETAKGISLNSEQQKSVMNALTEPVSIITGMAGTGKTSVLEAIYQVFNELAPPDSKPLVQFCTPTGKAAQRIVEATGIDATTIHNYIGLNSYNRQKDPDSLECDLLVVDEASMVSLEVFYHLCAVVKKGARLVLVGDENQLSSVGCGDVFSDILNSGAVPATVLKDVQRQKASSTISQNAVAILQHKKGDPLNLQLSNKTTDACCLLPADSPEAMVQIVKDVINTYPEAQVLTMYREKGPLSTFNLNKEMHDCFVQPGTAPSYTAGGKEFRVGDRVIHIHNSHTLQVFNGEIGTVINIGKNKDNRLQVDFSGKKQVWYKTSDLEDLELAYAITIHKAQGSEFPIVVIPIAQTMRKEHVYTALTRGKEKVIFVGSEDDLRQAAMSADHFRNTELKQRIQKQFGLPPSALNLLPTPTPSKEVAQPEDNQLCIQEMKQAS